MSITVLLPPETILNVSSNAEGSTAIVRRLSDAAGSAQRQSANKLLFPNINLNELCSTSIGPFSEQRRYLIDNIVGDITYTTELIKLNYNNLSSGVYEGGAVTIDSGDSTKFDIAAGKGVIMDSYTDPENPVVVRVSWPAITGIDTQFIAADFTSYVGIDRGGNVNQFVGPVSPVDKRDNVILAVLVHTSGTNLESVGEFNTPAYDVANNTADLANAIGFINIEGNRFKADGTDLKLARTSGSSFALGGNFLDSRKSPNIIDNDAISGPELFKPYRNGSYDSEGNPTGYNIDFPLTTSIDPDRFDDGTGTLQTMSGNQRFQIQRIYAGVLNDDVIVAYGQNTYRRMDDALASIDIETYQMNPVLRDTLLRGFLIVRRGTTDLSDTDDARFVAADKFGQVAAEGAQLTIPNGIDTVTSSPKTSDFTVNFNKAYRIDNSSGAVTGTLAEATGDMIGMVCECWIMSNPFTNNITFEAPTEASIINGVSAGVGQLVNGVVSAASTGYVKISITIIDENEYLISGLSSVVAV